MPLLPPPVTQLKIICIPPWKIQDISSSIDHFHNSASFQEMPKNVIENYAKNILRILNKKGSISLISHIDLNSFFNNSLLVKKQLTLLQPIIIFKSEIITSTSFMNDLAFNIRIEDFKILFCEVI